VIFVSIQDKRAEKRTLNAQLVVAAGFLFSFFPFQLSYIKFFGWTFLLFYFQLVHEIMLHNRRGATV
jgi:hypothetical protein